MTAMNAVMTDYSHRKTRHLSTPKPCTASLFCPHVLPVKEEDCRELKDNSSAETCHGPRNEKDGKVKNGTEEQSPDGNSQQGVEVRVRMICGTSPGRKGKRREISSEMGRSGDRCEKSNTWNKSCKESTKREAVLFKMVEVAVAKEKQKERERGMIRDLLVELRIRRTLIDEMQRNLDDAQNKSCKVEQKLNRLLWEYIDAVDKERGRPRFIMTTLADDVEQRNEDFGQGPR